MNGIRGRLAFLLEDWFASRYDARRFPWRPCGGQGLVLVAQVVVIPKNLLGCIVVTPPPSVRKMELIKL